MVALSEREQEVTRLVLQGTRPPTSPCASRSLYTPCSSNLKSAFEKTGVRSRRKLVGKVFFSHYEPRLRDNEQRVLEERPLRGGPL